MAAERSAVLLDWGGVMTERPVRLVRAPSAPRRASTPTSWPTSSATTATRERCSSTSSAGASRRPTSSRGLATALGLAWHDGLIDRLFAGAGARRGDGRRRARAARRAACATGLVSNSWGTRRYPRELLAELFDGIVISGEEGFRKPDPRMYELGAQRIGVAPAECVFVDDLAFNLDPARELGMAVVHHTSAATTLAELERLVGRRRDPLVVGGSCAALTASPRGG